MPARRLAVALVVLLILGSGCTTPPEPSAPVAAPTPARFKALDEQTLADQSADTRATFVAAHGDQAAEAWIAGHNQALLQGMADKAVLQASPDPVSSRAWAASTTITFGTDGNVVGQVFVSINGGIEKPFATAVSGSQAADWIWRGSSYEFRLYAGTHREQLLRSVTVTRANDAVAMLWPVPAAAALLLLVGGLLAAALGQPRSARLLKIAFGVVTTGLVVWLALTTAPRSLDEQPFPDSHEYADSAVHLAAGDGYVTTVHDDGPRPPRYPPGFPLALVPFAAFGGTYPGSVLGVTPGLGALYVVAAAATAWSLGGPIAAGLTAALVGTAPFAIESASLLMSDALVTALTLVLAGLLQRRAVGPAAAAALVAGGLALVRLSAAVAIPSLLLALPGRLLRRIGAFALPGLVVLAVFQWATFGSPWRTGYDYWLPDLKTFDVAYALQRPMGDGPTMVGDALNGQLLGWLCPCEGEGGPLTQLPNVLFYLAVIFGPFWVFAPPLVGLFGFVYALLHWREPAARFTVWLTLLTLVVLTIYVYQAARLAAAPAALLAIYAAVAAARALEPGGVTERVVQRLRLDGPRWLQSRRRRVLETPLDRTV